MGRREKANPPIKGTKLRVTGSLRGKKAKKHSKAVPSRWFPPSQGVKVSKGNGRRRKGRE